MIMYKNLLKEKYKLLFFILYCLSTIIVLNFSMSADESCPLNLKHYLEIYPDRTIMEESLNLIPEIENLKCIGKVVSESLNTAVVATNDTIYFSIIFFNPFLFILCMKIFRLSKIFTVVCNLFFVLIIEYIFNYRIGSNLLTYNLLVYPIIVFLLHGYLFDLNE